MRYRTRPGVPTMMWQPLDSERTLSDTETPPTRLVTTSLGMDWPSRTMVSCRVTGRAETAPRTGGVVELRIARPACTCKDHLSSCRSGKAGGSRERARRLLCGLAGKWVFLKIPPHGQNSVLGRQTGQASLLCNHEPGMREWTHPPSRSPATRHENVPEYALRTHVLETAGSCMNPRQR